MPRQAVDPSYYERFGLGPDATSAQIKKAYYQRARQCHPDKHHGDPEKERQFKALSEAYEVLSDEERRAVYDALGPEGMDGDSMHADPRQVFAAVFGGPEFEPWVGILGATVDEDLQAPLRAAQQRSNENHEKLIRLIRARAPADEISATREVQASLQAIEDQNHKAVADAAAQIQQRNVDSCAAALEAFIAPWVAAALGGDAVDAAARDLAATVFEESVASEVRSLRRCSMGEPLLKALGYAYVRQTQKVRGKRAGGAARLGGLYEMGLHGVHNVSVGLSIVGTYTYTCAYACTCTHIHICICVHVHTHIHTHAHAHIHTHTYTYTQIHTHTYACAYKCTYTYACARAYACACAYTHAHMHMHAHPHMHTHAR